METVVSGHDVAFVRDVATPTEQALLTQIQELQRLVDILAQGKYVWESTFDAISDPVLIINKDYQIIRINKAAAASGSHDIRDMPEKYCYEVFAGHDAPCPHCPLRNVLDTNAARQVRLPPFKSNQRSYDVHAYPFHDKYRGDAQVILHYRDVTEEEALTRKLLQSEKLAALGTLTGGIAHEINNPLSGILAFSQLIIRDLSPDASLFSDVKEIESAALRCKEIVEDLLEFSRAPSADEPCSVEINQLIQKLIPLVNVNIASMPIQIATVLSPDLPLAAGRPHKLQQVLLNLMTNGIHAMCNRGGTLGIKTSFEKDNLVCIEVKDDGEGIPPENLLKIFDPFFTTKKQGEGTGLGLSISYGIIKECGGTIDVQSECGVGTTMVIRLPIVQTVSNENLARKGESL